MESLPNHKRRAIPKAVWGLVVVLGIAAAAAIYSQSISSKPGTSGTVEVDIQIIEDDPVLQIQHFYPGNITLSFGQNVTLAIRNGDDEPRIFILKDFNVNITMGPGTTGRAAFQANKPGTFVYYSPPSAPSPVSQGRPGKYIQGNLTVTP
jgi:heme/copper-type cytochrome/quinol oxidase subunit 2